MTDKKYKIVVIGDHLISPSGVGNQARFLVEKLIATGKFQIIYLGAAMKHPDMSPQKFKEFGDSLVCIPTIGYGDKAVMRQILNMEKPDACVFITDPRFYTWLFSMEDEVHQFCPMIYWHVWDNLPAPLYNRHYYEATDYLACINKLTYSFLKEMGFGDKAEYLPHGVPEKEFNILPAPQWSSLRKSHIGLEHSEKFVLFYNSRNALRKRTGTVIYAYKKFLELLPEKERDNAFFIMHTPPLDPEGQNLYVLTEDLGLKGKIGFHDGRVPGDVMGEFYNMAHVTVSMSSEEGFGLCILESLMCGTPVVCTKTGGMQDQAIDGELDRTFGFCMESDATALIGSQNTPYIESHSISPEKVAQNMLALYNDWKELGEEAYKEKWAGQAAHESCMRRFNLEKIQDRWVEIVEEQIEKFKTNKNPLLRQIAI